VSRLLVGCIALVLLVLRHNLPLDALQ
jgi:hypothetical protein